jgi:hypothetical protein
MGFIPSFTVQMDIHDVLYLSYLIPKKRLRPAIPDNVCFAVNYQDKTILSLVVFHSKDVRVSFFPFFRFDYDQANIRTYIMDPITGKPAVFFLKSGITSPLIACITRMLGIPWQSISMHLDVQHDNNPPYQYAVEGNWEGNFNILLNKNQDLLIDMEPFQNPEEATQFLTAPSVGFYRSSGSIIRFAVQHSAVKPSMGKISAIDFPMIIRSGLLTDGELLSPHSALIAAHSFFSIAMPPTRVSI